MEHTPTTGIIIVAGGSGRRMGGSLPKQFQLLGNEPMLVRTIRTFAAALPGAPIVAVLPAEYAAYWHDLSARFDTASHRIVTGGAERFDSVRAGITALPEEVELIAVHDGARPLVSTELILRTVACAAAFGSAVPVVAPADSFRETAGDTGASHIVDRRRLRAVQTPQVFEAALLRRAYAVEYDPAFTDDASVVERTGHVIHLCDGERRNFKITEPEDRIAAEALLAAGEAMQPEEEPRQDLTPTASAAVRDNTPGGHACCCRNRIGTARNQPAADTCSSGQCACPRETDAPAGKAPRDPYDFASGGAGAIR